jgi:diaminohydroxyphosphoribosylaminopyrimidine deaminase/5-amino-6-(5-phosphoribosylamino)uracil reductase
MSCEPAWPVPTDSALALRAADVDERMMRHALALGRRGLGTTWPNPAVGAVVWRMGPSGPVVLGRGFTQPGGRPHAEPLALAQAGEAARGAILSVTLEPCSHHGQTAPCADAVREAGIARVVSAIEDPDPRVNGRGHIHLRAAGVEVRTGVLAREARRANLGFIRRIVERRPMVTLKLARTKDGYAARLAGPRLLITGEEANARVHMLRAMHDAVMVGIGTVLADDPLLTCRLPGLEDRSPVRVVLDSDLRIPLTSRLLRGAREVPLWIVAAEDGPAGNEAALTALGAEVIRIPRGPGGPLDVTAALRGLAARGVTRVFCEGGPRLAGALHAADVIDAAVLLTGAEPLGEPGLPALPAGLVAHLSDRRQFEADAAEPLGRDTLQSFSRIS